MRTGHGMGLWARTRDWVGKLLARPAPGRWLDGHVTAWRGWLGFRPWVLPRRHYRLYVPHGWSKDVPAPLVVLLHGCRQDPDAFARGTRIEAAADRAGILVLMPDQKDAANPWRCWNWFDGRTWRGQGEAAIVAAMIEKLLRKTGADRARVVVAGMSSGAALAAVLGVRHPALVRGVVAHAGLACGAAASAFTAISAMRRGPESDVAAIAREARRAAGGAVRVPLVAVQGRDDEVVAPLHAAALARQYLALNGVEVPAGAATSLPPPTRTVHDTPLPAHAVRTRVWERDGVELVRLVEVDGLGHAWSGGDPALPYHAAGPPDATAMLADWAVALPR